MEDPLGYGLGVFSFLASVVLSVTEGALSDFSWTKLEALAEAKKVSGKIGHYLKREDDLALAASTLKVAMNVLFVLVAVHLSLEYASVAGTYIIGLSAMAGIILIANVPAFLVGRRLAEPTLIKTLPILNGIRFFLQPALWASRFGGEIMARIFGSPNVETQAESIHDEILSAAVEGRREGVIREEEHDMIEGIIRFRERQISNVMTPRTEMVSIAFDTPVVEAGKFALSKGFSRIPVYRDTRDNIVGVLHVRDLLGFWDSESQEPPSLEELVREAHYTPETKKVAELFEELRARKVHMAVVLDEYGGTAGLITIEDILEEIVGEIEDEYDVELKTPFRRLDERTAVVDGRLRIDELNEKFQVEIPEDNGYDTVGGYLCSAFGRVPKSGEIHNLDHVEFTVMDADQRKVHQVQVIKDSEV
ncbi:MAG: hemolysin family protein [Planctomycetota bacterium]